MGAPCLWWIPEPQWDDEHLVATQEVMIELKQKQEHGSSSLTVGNIIYVGCDLIYLLGYFAKLNFGTSFNIKPLLVYSFMLTLSGMRSVNNLP